MTSSLRLARGSRIRQLRVDRHMSGADLARAIGVTRSFIHRIEQGQNGVSDENLVKIAAALEVPVAALYEEPATDGPSGSATPLTDHVLAHLHRAVS